MITRRMLGLAAAAVALGGGLASGPVAAQAAPANPQTRYVEIWHGSHGPAGYWATADFVPHGTRWLATNFGCYGHDGAKIKAEIVRTKDRHVVNDSGYYYCNNGEQRRLDATIARGTSYYMRLYLKGPKHSMYAKAYEAFR
ncbi:hypothetical protein [Streptomyces orinoci]|uniref:Secreted protein n=1 Tax=Streptomyces orinoci TaxID=67339 RepID=A0ABV3JUV0_STRON|nr:hypothetical protein [Streptomyces orinoci]